jgi:hypothetical protein
MTTAVTANLITHLDNPTNQQKPNATDKPKGHAVLGPGNRFTPEASLEPDNARNEADLSRRQAEIEQADNPIPSIEEVSEDAREDSTTRSQPPDDDEEPKADIQDVLKCKRDDYHGILKLDDKYDDPTVEMAAIEWAVYSRGTDLHPKFNGDEGAQEAFQSESPSHFEETNCLT